MLGIRPPDFMRRLPTTRYSFTGIRSESSDEDRPGYICVVGRKPA